jgi:outer membrane protein
MTSWGALSASQSTQNKDAFMTATAFPSRLLAVAALVGAALLPAAAHAVQASDFMVRVRAVYLDPVNEGDIPGLAIDSKWIPEVDLTWFATPNFALELVATVPQKQTVTLDGVGTLGTLRHLPPTLMAQYHFMPTSSSVRPYVGIGMNYTHFSAVNLNQVSGVNATVGKQSTGIAFQVGADVPLTSSLYLNVDLKKIDIRTEVYVNGARAGLFKIDPMLLGVGIGYRF